MQEQENQPQRRRKLALERTSAFAGITLVGAALVQACSSSSAPGVDSQGGTNPPGGEEGGALGDGAGPGPGQDGASNEDGSSIGPGGEGGTEPDGRSLGDGGRDVGPYIDAPLVDRYGGHDSCNSKWWATGSAFDTTVTPSSFSSAMNPIVGSSSIHPFTLAIEDEDGGAVGTASGSTTDGAGNQYFPPSNSATATTMTVTSTGVATAAPEGSAWLHVHDAGGRDIWIPIANVALSATYGDPGCGTLIDGTLTAVITAAASSITIQPIGQSATTVGALLGTPTSTSPAGGWNVLMTFGGSSVQVD